MRQYSVILFLTLVISAKFEKIHIDRSEFNEIDYYYRNRSSDQPKNYLNYRDVYGIRYSPKRKVLRLPITSDMKYNKNYSTAHNESNNRHFLITTIPASIESEAMSPLSNESVMESTTTIVSLKNHQQQQQQEDSASSDDEEEFEQQQNLAHNSNNKNHNNNDDIEITEQDVDETKNHHIMKPNNRVEHALNFLANRMKNLMLLSNEQHRIEPNISPHLLSLGKFLNLFSLIRVDTFPCVTGRRPLRQLFGSCMNEAECVNLGGISMDRCANGFGVCCIFKTSCGHVTQTNVTYFESPNFPMASQTNLGSCTLTILLAPTVRQVLVEFLFFEILPPKDGDCIDDQFTISTEMGSKNHEVPIICGVATGQHMYVDVTGSEKLFLSILTHTSDDRAFNIKVTQLSLHDNIAPTGCLQFHTEIDGTIKTFNYDDNYSQIIKFRNPTYFNNMNYAICIKKHPGYCTIQYVNEYKGKEEVFELVNVDANGNFLSKGQAGAEIFSCPDDFIAVNYIRLCGYKLNDGALSINFNLNMPVRSVMNGPIVMPVKSDNSTVGRGFNIHYFQEKC